MFDRRFDRRFIIRGALRFQLSSLGIRSLDGNFRQSTHGLLDMTRNPSSCKGYSLQHCCPVSSSAACAGNQRCCMRLTSLSYLFLLLMAFSYCSISFSSLHSSIFWSTKSDMQHRSRQRLELRIAMDISSTFLLISSRLLFSWVMKSSSTAAHRSCSKACIASVSSCFSVEAVDFVIRLCS
jgi:hypothetical protein